MDCGIMNPSLDAAVLDLRWLPIAVLVGSTRAPVSSRCALAIYCRAVW